MLEPNGQAIADYSALTGAGGFLHPERILNYLDLRPGMIVADFGCGGGYFSIPAARRVGESGKVYAIDIQKRIIELVKSRANLEHLLNVETIWADLEREKGSRLRDGIADLAIVANILFQAEKKKAIIEETWRILRLGGHLAVIEWDETPFPAGPKLELRIGRQQIQNLAEEAGFELEKEFEAGSHHYGLLFKKK